MLIAISFSNHPSYIFISLMSTLNYYFIHLTTNLITINAHTFINISSYLTLIFLYIPLQLKYGAYWN